MSYVKWKSKYHMLSKRSSGLTRCSLTSPEDAEYFDTLPEGVDAHQNVCHVCSQGVGVPKVDEGAERTRVADAERVRRAKIAKLVAKSTSDLFD